MNQVLQNKRAKRPQPMSLEELDIPELEGDDFDTAFTSLDSDSGSSYENFSISSIED